MTGSAERQASSGVHGLISPPHPLGERVQDLLVECPPAEAGGAKLGDRLIMGGPPFMLLRDGHRDRPRAEDDGFGHAGHDEAGFLIGHVGRPADKREGQAIGVRERGDDDARARLVENKARICFLARGRATFRVVSGPQSSAGYASWSRA